MLLQVMESQTFGNKSFLFAGNRPCYQSCLAPHSEEHPLILNSTQSHWKLICWLPSSATSRVAIKKRRHSCRRQDLTHGCYSSGSRNHPCHCGIFRQVSARKRHPIQSQFSAPPVWYSMTRVSKKFRSFFRSIISAIQGKGFSSCGNMGSMPICWARRLAMKRR